MEQYYGKILSMKKKAEKSIDEIFKEGTLIDSALKKAVQEALIRHKHAGNYIVVWRDGKIVWLKPEEIPLANSFLVYFSLSASFGISLFFYLANSKYIYAASFFLHLLKCERRHIIPQWQNYEAVMMVVYFAYSFLLSGEIKNHILFPY